MALKGRELCVSKVPIFSDLTHDELLEVFGRVNHREIKKGAYLYMAGESNDSLYVIHKGAVRIYRLNADGDEQLIRVLTHSDFTGELSLFNPDDINESYAEVLQDASVCVIERGDIYELMQKYPGIGIKFVESFTSRLNESELMTTNISLLTSKERLLEYITTHTKDDRLVLTMTKKNLASYLSMKPETLTRTFNKLEGEGYVKKLTNKEYAILSEELIG